MKTLLYTSAIALLALPAYAQQQPENVFTIENIPDEGPIQVSGIVTWVEDDDEFTLADSTGDVEVEMAEGAVKDVDIGDYVTITGNVDDNILQDEIEDAQVAIVSPDYDTWAVSYETTYGVDYDYDNVTEDFFEVTTYDPNIYDNSYYTWYTEK
jgi:hypothetical protein